MNATTTGTLSVPGASLHYEIRGAGPVLLVAPGGEGGVALAADLVARLAADYTVVTYDRRGMSRSRLHDPAAPVTIATHADDMHRLLAAVTDEPAFVLGSSFGALVGLTMAVAHPRQVRTLVAHDPATIRLLPPDARARAERDLTTLTQTFRQDGALPALKKLGELVGGGFPDREPDVAPPAPPGPERLADLEFFFSNDLGEILTADLDADHIATLASGPARVVPAAGRASRDLWNYACARAMADLLDTDVAEFPGGHSLSTHPTAFAARLHDLLTSRPQARR